jgi:hypothetical protein
MDTLANKSSVSLLLNRTFYFAKTHNVSRISIHDTGMIDLYTEPLANNNSIGRLHVADNYYTVPKYDNPATVRAGLFLLDTGLSYVISWESGWIAARIRVSFQVEMYDNGNVEYRSDYLGAVNSNLPVVFGIELGQGTSGLFNQTDFPGTECVGFYARSQNGDWQPPVCRQDERPLLIYALDDTIKVESQSRHSSLATFAARNNAGALRSSVGRDKESDGFEEIQVIQIKLSLQDETTNVHG